MATVAFCGLGQMGSPMATRLLESGVELVVWNRSPERAVGLDERGARVAATPAEAAREAEVVITMLSTPDAVQAVVLGEDGVVEGLAGRSGTMVIEMSTIGPTAVAALRDGLPEGVDLLDAPVLGSVKQATEGALKVFVGGDAEVFERARPLLERLGAPRLLGPQGAGAAMKLVANLCLGVLMSGLGEALALARSLGLHQGDVLDVLVESPIGTTAKSKRSNIESGQYRPNFKLALAAKDLGLVEDRASADGLDLPVAAAARQWFDAANASGLGDNDYSAVIKTILES